MERSLKPLCLTVMSPQLVASASVSILQISSEFLDGSADVEMCEEGDSGSTVPSLEKKEAVDQVNKRLFSTRLHKPMRAGTALFIVQVGCRGNLQGDPRSKSPHTSLLDSNIQVCSFQFAYFILIFAPWHHA